MTARTEPFHVEAVTAERLHDLRRRVLRSSNPAASVRDDRDDDATAMHFAGFLEDQIVAAGSFYPSESPTDPDLVAYQLRYLATEFSAQGRGFGSVLMRAAEGRLCRSGVDQLWANARDTALGFYTASNWQLVPESQHLSVETQLPHTVITKPLRSRELWKASWAKSADAVVLASLREEMHFAISMREFDELWIAASQRYFEKELDDGTMIAAVARTSGGEVISSAVASLRTVAPTPRFPQGSCAYIHTVSTRPAFRCRGISRALMDLLLDELRARKIERAELHAAPDGEAIYRAMGFEDRRSGPELRLALCAPQVN